MQPPKSILALILATLSFGLQACWSQKANFSFSLTPGSSAGASSDSKLTPFKGFECQPGSAPSPAPVLQKYTSIESADRARMLIEGMVTSSQTAQEIISRLVAIQATAGIPSERSGQYERQSATSSLDQATINALFRISGTLASTLRSNTTWLSQFAGSCALTTPPTPVCLQTYVSKLLSIALSTPASSATVSELVSTLQAHPSDWLEASMTYAFLSAAAVNRVELGSEQVSSGWMALSEMELAHRLASIFWMSLPDVQLRSWAQAGQLRARYEEVLSISPLNRSGIDER